MPRSAYTSQKKQKKKKKKKCKLKVQNASVDERHTPLAGEGKHCANSC